MQLFTQALTAQHNRDSVAPENTIKGMSTYRVRYSLRKKTPKFYDSNVKEYPQGFIDEVYKVHVIMGLTSIEKVDLASYRLRDVVNIWNKLWKDSRYVVEGPTEWKGSTRHSLKDSFPKS